MNTIYYIYYNIFLIPEYSHDPITAKVFVAIGALASLISAIILIYLAIKEKKCCMPAATRTIYIASALFLLWASIIYIMATVGLLNIPTSATMIPPSYGNYLRPVLAFLLLSPGLIALANRR